MTCQICLDQLLEPDPPEELIVVNNQGAPSLFEVGVADIPIGVQSVSVIFATEKLSGDYTFNELAIENTVDLSPLTILANVQSRSKFGFTVSLNGITDTANYKLRFEVEVVVVSP